MPSIFTRIINGEIPCHHIAENDDFIAFLDVRPIVKGHTLVVPKKEIDYIFDNDDTTLAALLPFAKRVAAAIEAVVPCKRCFISVIGLEVPHTHIHLIPANRMGDYSFKNKVEMSGTELAELAKAIAEKMDNG
ncbi:MAG: HIT family protein [Saprospiraceae bacterium]|nr:HIT family protein [Saprospiraceae bacterium]